MASPVFFLLSPHSHLILFHIYAVATGALAISSQIQRDTHTASPQYGAIYLPVIPATPLSTCKALTNLFLSIGKARDTTLILLMFCFKVISSIASSSS